MEPNHLNGAATMAPPPQAAVPIPLWRQALMPRHPDDLTSDETRFFQVVLNCDEAKKFVREVPRDELTQRAQLLHEACECVLSQDKSAPLTPDRLITALERLADDEAGHERHQAFMNAARFVETKLCEVPRDVRSMKASEAEEFVVWITGKPIKRFNLLSIPELFSRPDPEFLVDRMIVAGSTVLFSAKEASYKSFLATDLAACVATGKPWHGLRVKSGPVVYVAAEGAAGLRKRLQAWMHHHNEKIGADKFFVLDEPLQIASPADRDAFISQVDELKPVLIVLDTLRRCSTGLDENSAADMGLFMDALGDLARQTSAACMGIHHNNKSGGYSGSTTLAGSVDTRLTCVRDRDDVVKLTTEKQKDFEEYQPMFFEKQIVPVPGSKGEATSLVFKRMKAQPASDALTETEQRVLDALADQGEKGATNAAWKEASGLSNSAFNRALIRLLDLKRAETIKGQRGERGAVYAVAPNPVAAQQDSE